MVFPGRMHSCTSEYMDIWENMDVSEVLISSLPGSVLSVIEVRHLPNGKCCRDLKGSFISVMTPESAWGLKEGVQDESLKCREFGNPETSSLLAINGSCPLYL